MALAKFTTIKGRHAKATDKELGAIKDVYFDDRTWRVRYFVVDTAKWLPGRKVLVSPDSVRGYLPHAPVPIALSSREIEACPPLDAEKPVSRQYESALSEYYGWAQYWEPRAFSGTSHPLGMYLHGQRYETVPQEVREILDARRGAQDVHLRSCREVRGYHVAASDGEIGHIDDFLIDVDSWEIPYLVVDTRNWLPGRKVTIPQHVISSIRWSDRKVHVITPRELIEGSPEMDEAQGESDLEQRVLHHYFSYYDRPASMVSSN